MSFLSFLKKTVTDFRGAWTVRDQTRQTAQRASLSQNVRFFPGKTFTRPGTGIAVSLGTGAISTFFSWIANFVTTPEYRILYLMAPDQVKLYNQNANVNDALYTQACTGLSVVEAETRAYIGHYDSNAQPVGNLKIVNSELSGEPADDGFPNPTNELVVAADAGVGVITAGPHNFAYRIESRTGFPGRPSPEVTGTFTPTKFTVAPGGRSVRLTVTFPVVPPDTAVIQFCMTTTDNLEQYFDIPGAHDALPPNATGWVETLVVSITDEDLVLLSGTPAEITDNFSFLTQGHGAPTPSKVAKLGNRNCYVQDNTVFISDPYNLQVLRQPDNAIQGPGQRTIITVEETTNGQLAMFGYDWTAVLGGDNSRKPREWAPPARVSGTIGSPGINGVIPSAGHQFLWVCAPAGLFTFNGVYGQMPVSYMFSADWKRINWGAAQTLQGVDDTDARCLKINVPLDGATAPNFRMVIDYSRAKSMSPYSALVDPMQVDYSLDDLDNASAISSTAMVDSFANKLRESWIGLPNGRLIREDPTLRTDAYVVDTLAGIHSLYETGLNLSPSEASKLISRFGGAHLDVKGSGQLIITPYGLGRQVSSDDPVDPVQLSETPDGMEETRWHMQSENQTIRMEVTGVGDWFDLQEAQIYYRPSGTTKAT